jgi:hypothetical protein
VVANYGKLLVASRNLDFFTSFYRFLIQLLPAAVVAPLFFAGAGLAPVHCSRHHSASVVVHHFEVPSRFHVADEAAAMVPWPHASQVYACSNMISSCVHQDRRHTTSPSLAYTLSDADHTASVHAPSRAGCRQD